MILFRMPAKSLSTDGTEGELAKNQATISIIAIIATSKLVHITTTINNPLIRLRV